MFNVSKKIDYGLLLMASLPDKGSQEFRSLQDIAEEKHLSVGFLSQIMVPLKKAKLVQSREGSGGGYQLAKSSSDITLSEVYEALDGPLHLTACQKEECVCERDCPTKDIWAELQQMMDNYLHQKTLSDIKN